MYNINWQAIVLLRIIIDSHCYRERRPMIKFRPTSSFYIKLLNRHLNVFKLIYYWCDQIISNKLNSAEYMPPRIYILDVTYYDSEAGSITCRPLKYWLWLVMGYHVVCGDLGLTEKSSQVSSKQIYWDRLIGNSIHLSQEQHATHYSD